MSVADPVDATLGRGDDLGVGVAGQVGQLHRLGIGPQPLDDAIPSGPIGAIQTGALALLLGKAMVATRALGWPLIIHLAIDVVIFAAAAVAAT